MKCILQVVRHTEHIALYRTIVLLIDRKYNGLLIKSHKCRGGRLRV